MEFLTIIFLSLFRYVSTTLQFCTIHDCTFILPSRFTNDNGEEHFLVVLKIVANFKLHVTIQCHDNRLTFSRHIDLLVGKIAGKLKTFQRVRNSLDNRARRSFYISLIQTSLLNGSNAFSPCLSITHVNRLITISKRAQRISFGYPPSAHAALIRARHNLIPLDSLLLFKRLVVVFRSLRSLGSCLLDSLFSFRYDSNSTSTVTRAQVTNCLGLPDVRTRSGLQSLSYTAAKEWNSLPPLFAASVPSQHSSCIFVII